MARWVGAAVLLSSLFLLPFLLLGRAAFLLEPSVSGLSPDSLDNKQPDSLDTEQRCLLEYNATLTWKKTMGRSGRRRKQLYYSQHSIFTRPSSAEFT
jgi:hypothetical protein